MSALVHSKSKGFGELPGLWDCKELSVIHDIDELNGRSKFLNGLREFRGF